MPMLPDPEPRYRPRHRAKAHPVRLLTVGATLGVLAASVSLAAPAIAPGQRHVDSATLSIHPRFGDTLGFGPQPAQPGAEGPQSPGRPIPIVRVPDERQRAAQWIRRLRISPDNEVPMPATRTVPPVEIRLPGQTPSPTPVEVVADPPRLPGGKPKPSSPPTVTPTHTPKPKPKPRGLPSPSPTTTGPVIVTSTPSPTSETPTPTETPTDSPTETPTPTPSLSPTDDDTPTPTDDPDTPCPTDTQQEGSVAPPTPEPSATTTLGDPLS